MKRITSFICLFTIFIQVYLFAEDDLSIEAWSIDDYKKAIIVRNRNMIIYEFVELANFETGERYFLCKSSVNAMDKYKDIALYAFNKGYEYQRFLLSFGNDEDDNEVLMRGILGNHLWGYMVSIGDFNNDGINEIASLAFTGSEPVLKIISIDPYSKEIVHYLNEGISVDYPPTYTPVEFINYKGMNGFKIKKYIPPNIQTSKPIKFPSSEDKFRNLAWIFYTWDETQRKYIEVEEVDPRYIGEEGARLYQREKEELNKNEIEHFSDSKTNLENESPQTTKDSQFPLWLFIGGGLVLLAAVGVGVVVIVKKRNKAMNTNKDTVNY